MSLPSQNFVAAGALAVAGLPIGLVLHALSTWIPHRLEQQWLRDSAETLEVPPPALAPSPDLRQALTSKPARLAAVVNAILFAGIGCLYGWQLTAVMWAAFVAMLFLLAMIDLRTQLLPDVLTQPLIWAGLGASALGLTGVPLTLSLAGAMAGYLLLWTVYWVFKLLTGKDGLGFGDFKLLAALGAWFGLSALLPILTVAACSGLAVGLLMRMSKRLEAGGLISFGPFLVAGALAYPVFR